MFSQPREKPSSVWGRGARRAPGAPSLDRMQLPPNFCKVMAPQVLELPYSALEVFSSFLLSNPTLPSLPDSSQEPPSRAPVSALPEGQLVLFSVSSFCHCLLVLSSSRRAGAQGGNASSMLVPGNGTSLLTW